MFKKSKIISSSNEEWRQHLNAEHWKFPIKQEYKYFKWDILQTSYQKLGLTVKTFERVYNGRTHHTFISVHVYCKTVLRNV